MIQMNLRVLRKHGLDELFSKSALVYRVGPRQLSDTGLNSWEGHPEL